MIGYLHIIFWKASSDLSLFYLCTCGFALNFLSSLCILSGYKSCVRRVGLKLCWLFHLQDMCTQLEIGLHLFIFVTSVVGNLHKHCCLCQNFRDSPISNLIASDFTFGVSIYFVLDSYILRKGRYFIPLVFTSNFPPLFVEVFVCPLYILGTVIKYQLFMLCEFWLCILL